MTTTSERKTKIANGNGRAIGGVASMNAYVKSIADIMRCSGRAGALQYVPEMTWMIFLRMLDECEQREAAEVTALGKHYSPTLEPPYRWFDWAAPYDPAIKDAQGLAQGWKRKQLQEREFGAVMRFVNNEAQGILDAVYDLKAVNPNATDTGDQQTPDELLKIIEEAQREISAGISALRTVRRGL